MKLEEYIAKRKKEDGINEFEYEKRMENTRICTNYVFEYFNNYLDTLPADERTVLQDKKNEKYRILLTNKGYNLEMTEWLVCMYSSYGKYMDKNLMNAINDDYFLLYDNEAEFRALSYEVYSKTIKRFPFLEGQSEMIYKYLKEAHYVRNLFHWKEYYISPEINEWIDKTYKKYGVNIYNFCMEWVDFYFDHPEIWPKGSKNSEGYYNYKQTKNLFGLDQLYRQLPKKKFIKGKKQELEIVLMYCWLHDIDDDDEYWEEYIQKVTQN